MGLAFIAVLALVWGTNGFVLGKTATDTGWPRMVAIAGGLVFLGVLVRHHRAPDDRDAALEPYPWDRRNP